MRIADITCDSNTDQFLNLSELEEIISYLNENNIAKLREESLEPLLKEIEFGGLDEYSLNIGGNPILHEKAVIIGKGLDAAFDELTSTKNIILSEGKNHLIEELNTYISKLDEKITRLSQDISSYRQKINTANRSGDKQNLSGYKNAEDKLTATQRSYSEKRNIAKSLLNEAQQYKINYTNRSDYNVSKGYTNNAKIIDERQDYRDMLDIDRSFFKDSQH